jgi:two-component sensor histidine kinase
MGRGSATIAAIAAYLALAAGLLPWAAKPGPELTGLVPFFVAGVLVAELATSFLLFSAFSERRTWPLLLLGCGYLYAGLMSIPHLLTFPGAVLTGRSVIGTAQSTAWIFITWILGYALAMALAVVLEAPFPAARVRPSGVRQAILWGCLATGAAVILLSVIATAGIDHLPALLADGQWTALNLTLNNLAIAILGGAVFVILTRLRHADELYLWLALALTAIAAANILSGTGGGRYTLGWTLGRLSWVVAASVLFLYFMRQAARQRWQLAETNEGLEQRVAARTADLQSANDELAKAVHERELLLREVYHRVKNNLQLVDSLLAFQWARTGQGEARAALEDVRRRVNALGLVHQQLMQSPNITTLDLRTFLHTLAANLTKASGGGAEVVAASDPEPLPVNIDFAVPLGLLVTELASATLGRVTGAGRVEISLRTDAAGIVKLTVTQPQSREGEEAARMDNRIVNALVAQLQGKMNVSDCGSIVAVVMPYPEAQA